MPSLDDTITEYLSSTDLEGGYVKNTKLDLVTKTREDCDNIFKTFIEEARKHFQFVRDFAKLASMTTGVPDGAGATIITVQADGTDGGPIPINDCQLELSLQDRIGNLARDPTTMNPYLKAMTGFGPNITPATAKGANVYKVGDFIKMLLRFAAANQAPLGIDAARQVKITEMETLLTSLINNAPKGEQGSLKNEDITTLDKEHADTVNQLSHTMSMAEAILKKEDAVQETLDFIEIIYDLFYPSNGPFKAADEPLTLKYKNLRQKTLGALKQVGKGLSDEWRPVRENSNDEDKEKENKMLRTVINSTLSRREQLVRLVKILTDHLNETPSDAETPAPVGAGPTNVTARRAILSQDY